MTIAITLKHGDEFERLTVLSVYKKDARKCVVGCACGHQFLARRAHLLKGRITQCIRCTNGPRS